MPIKVGQIQNHEVIYIPEKDVIFCKNTTVKFPIIQRIIRGNALRDEIPEKQLVITKDDGIVTLGCLTTTLSNCLSIEKSIKRWQQRNQ